MATRPPGSLAGTGRSVERARPPLPAGALDEPVERILAWGLAAESDLLDGDLVVSSSSRRNLNLRIERRRGPSTLVKQADLAAGAELVSTEAGFYRFCAAEPAASRVAAAMPGFVEGLESDRVLVLELVAGARSLWQALRAHGPPELPAAPHRELGRILGTLHATFAEDAAVAAPRPPGLRGEAPGYFWYHRPHPQMLRTASPARLELCRCLQAEAEACTGLEEAAQRWRAETVVHGDVRSENVLVVEREGEPPRVLLVDWELVQLGDPAWDLAGALEDLVRFWLESMSQRPELEPAERMATARWPLPAIQAAVRELRAGYAETADVGAAELAPRWIRAVAYSAPRMLQTAWESCRTLDRMSSLSVLLVQLAVNILSDPEAAAETLYDLGEVSGREAASVA